MLTSNGIGESASATGAVGSSALANAIFCSSDSICAIFLPASPSSIPFTATTITNRYLYYD